MAGWGWLNAVPRMGLYISCGLGGDGFCVGVDELPRPLVVLSFPILILSLQ